MNKIFLAIITISGALTAAGVATTEMQTVEGEVQDPTAPPPEEKPAEGTEQ